MSAKVFVGNLNYRTTPEQLQEFLSPAGEIVDVYFATDRDTGRPRGFAFVTFSDESQAAEAIRQFNGSDLDGRALNINEARDRPPRGGPGGGPGGPPRGPREGGRPRRDGPPRERGGGGGGGGGGFGRDFGNFNPPRDMVPPEEGFDPSVEKDFDNRNFDRGFEEEDGFGSDAGGRNKYKKGKKKAKGSRRGLRARKRSL